MAQHCAMRKKVRARFEVTWYDIVKCKTPLSLSLQYLSSYTTLLYTLHYTTLHYNTMPYRRQPQTAIRKSRKSQTGNRKSRNRRKP